MLKVILNIVQKEFNQIKNSRITVFLYSLFPIIIFLCFSIVYQNEIIREIPVAIVDEDKSDLSRTLIQYIESSPSMKIVNYCESKEELKEEFLRGKIHGGFYFPAELSSDIKSGKQSNVVMFIDASNLLISNSLLNDGTKILKTVNAGILLKKFKSGGLTENQSLNLVNPLKVETNVLYNPNYSYITYLIPGLTTFILMMVVMMGAVPIINHKIGEKDFQFALRETKGKILPVLIGKSIPHLLFHLANILILVGIIFPAFQIVIRSSIIITILYLFFFITVSFSFGIMLSSLIPKRTLATEVALFVLTPAFIYSGLTFPLWAMPGIHQFLAKLIPFTYFLSGFIKLYEMNLDIIYLKNELMVLMIFFALSFSIAILSIKIRLKQNGIGYDEKN
ncbi:MAG: ABC transporter permease [Ignavibacterium sp.]|jgi:ABC-2 type transport system permease protein|uniref:ABC transporter permease n=1 Tax=Ignavibacterium sp. TaxID=2651167 RepID=UPI003299CA85